MEGIYAIGFIITAAIGFVVLGWRTYDKSQDSEWEHYLDNDMQVMEALLGFLVALFAALTWPFALLFLIGFSARKNEGRVATYLRKRWGETGEES